MATDRGLALLVVGSAADRPQVDRLLVSIQSYNESRLPVVSLTSETPDEVRLSHWEAEDFEHVVCLDPSTVFIRPFSSRDFMAAPGVPFAFLSEFAEAAVDPQGFETWQRRQQELWRMRDEVGLQDPRFLTGRDCAVLSASALRSFRDDFLTPRGWSYGDALARVPDALGWYSVWLQKARPLPYVEREPIVLTMSTGLQYLQEAVRRPHLDDLARGYVGVVVRPPHHLSEVAPGAAEPRYRLVARHVRPSEAIRAAGLRIYRQLPSLQRLVARFRRRA